MVKEQFATSGQYSNAHNAESCGLMESTSSGARKVKRLIFLVRVYVIIRLNSNHQVTQQRSQVLSHSYVLGFLP